MLRVLLVQTQDQSAQFLARFFEERGDVVATVADLGKAATFISEFKPDLMVLDLHFQGNEWMTFLRLVRLEYPNQKIIITNKYPDLQREMRVREQGITTFVRYPFTQYWLNRALKSLGFTVKLTSSRSLASLVRSVPEMHLPVRLKITLPYLVLSLIFALASAYVVSQLILKTTQQRFLTQLVDTRLQASNWMAHKEDALLQSLRLIVHTQGVEAAVRQGNSDRLRALILPLIVNSNDEIVEVLNGDGTNVVSIQRPSDGQAGGYQFSRGDVQMGQTSFVRSILQGQTDQQGDKYAGMVSTSRGDYFFVAGPIISPSGENEGVVLVGNSLTELSRNLSSGILSDITFYGIDGQPVASTLFTSGETFPVDREQSKFLVTGQSQSSATRTLTVGSAGYVEMLGVWEVRGSEKLGLLGVAQPQTFLMSTGPAGRWEIFVGVTVGILLVTGVGLYLAGIITSPLQRLVTASNQISQGNLDVKVEVKGDAEVAMLTQSFNQMVTGLQEGVIYRDLLGQTASPTVREQLREAFSSGSVKLEGQETVGTVVFSDIRGFMTLAEQTEPSRVFDWLNEYFNQLVPIINRHGGVVNHFDGDAILSFFGILPTMLTPQDSAMAACRAALDMLKAADELNVQRSRRGDPLLITGVGINTGVMIAGGMGTSDRLHYAIIGSTVNTTQRLESLTRDFYPGNGILISHATYTALGNYSSDFRVESLGRRIIKEKMDHILVYRLLPLETESLMKVIS